MRLLIAIVQDYDCDRLLRTVTSARFQATKISSTGGFLRSGNTTVLIGVQTVRVAECLRLIELSCRSRIDVQLDASVSDYVEWFPSGFHEVTVGGAVVFIARVARFERLYPDTTTPSVLSEAGAGSER